MRTLRAPILNGLVRLREVIQAKQGRNREILDAVSPVVRGRYGVFITSRARLEAIPRRQMIEREGEEDEKSALLHCYDSPTVPLRKLKSDMIVALRAQGDVNLLQCPYCLVREPKTWDHFLPKDHYPDFSVMPMNLIYVCHSCNNKKSNRLYNAPRSVINSYFDRLPLEEMLECEITIQNGVPLLDYKISLNDQPSDVEAIVNRHFDKFELKDLYTKEGISLVSIFMDELAHRYPTGINQNTLVDEIDSRYSAIPLDWGANHWKAATFIGLRDCADFFACLNDHIQDRSYARANKWVRI